MVKKQSKQTAAAPAPEMIESDKPGRGQPEHKPSDEQRKLVEVLAQYGVKHKSIAAQLGMSINTLRKHYLSELLVGDAKVQGLVGQTALRVALGGPAEYYPMTHPDPALRGKLAKAEREPSERLLEFFMKTRMGLVPHIGVELDPFGKPEDIEHNTAGMTNKERIERIAGLFDQVAKRMQQKVPPTKKATTDGTKSVN